MNTTDESRKLRTRAAELHKLSIVRAHQGRTGEADNLGREADALDRQATDLEHIAENTVPARFSGGHYSHPRHKNCTTCKEPVRGGAKPHYLLPGTMTISVHSRGENQGVHDSESRRYCARCALVVKDALMELGFTFQKEDEDGPAVLHVQNGPMPLLAPGRYTIKKSEDL